jgi:cysteine desulfurase
MCSPKPSGVYFDNNATTALDSGVLEAMLPFLRESYANPSSPCSPGREAAAGLAAARENVAALAGCAPSSIVLTSGGTEGNNTALWGACRALPHRRRIVLTRVEHASVLRCAEQLVRDGRTVSLLDVDARGMISLEELERQVDENTALVSVMSANNETGVVYPVEACASLAHRRGALFHTDAVQAAGKIALSTASEADFVVISSHKIHGPKGAGALVLRPGTPFEPLLTGGDQERSRRAGTENVAAAAGFGRAALLASHALRHMDTTVRSLRDSIEDRLLALLPDLAVAGRGSPRIPNTSYFMIGGVNTEALLALLDMDGICCSSGSACSAGAHETSHVLEAMGLARRPDCGLLRVSLSRLTTAAEADYLVARAVHVVHQLRAGERTG